MKRHFSITLIVFLFFGIISPVSASAASKTYYYPVEGSEKVAPGIYQGTLNGKGKAVVKEKIYKKKNLSKPPVTIDGTYTFYGKGAVAKKSDYDNMYNLITNPIQHVQANGKDLYYTKYLFETFFNGFLYGGETGDILEIYKRNSNGKVVKVVNDKVTSNTVEAFVIKDKYIYYPKLNKDPVEDFSIVRATIDGKKKTILKKSVDDFWIHGKYIYYVYYNALYRMDMNGKNSKKYANLVFYPNSEFSSSNYRVSTNGVVVEDYEAGKDYFLEYSTGKTTKIAYYAMLICDVDTKKKRLVGMEWNGKNYTAGVYDYKGKLLKTLVKSMEYSDIYSVDAKKGEFIYNHGSSLKKASF